jgi:DNA invertase Pin-like site-specific DNA recombinase
MKAAISYRRLSKERSGRPGLGLEAQEAAIAAFCAVEGFQIIGDFVEVETGKGYDALERRPQLAAAMAEAKKAKAPIIVAKLDRLSRNVAFIAGLMEKRVPFVVCSLGVNVDPFMLHIYAAFAEKERNEIAARTKAALAAAKVRGIKLGAPPHVNQAQAEAAQAYAESLREIVWPYRHVSSRRLARLLNSRGLLSPAGKPWQSRNVDRLVQRLTKEKAE